MAGYSELASLFARFPEYQMFRKFDKLSVLMLLYLQAELITLEKQLEVYSKLDENNEGTRGIGKCWENMKTAFHNGKASLQRDTIQNVQDKLGKYHELLLRTAQVHRLGQPAAYDHELLNDWLSSSRGGNNFLEGFEATPWQTKFKPDLVSLVERTDSLDQWLARHLTPICHFFGRHRKADTDPELGLGQLWEYKRSNFVALGTVCCVCLSSMVPLASVFALFWVTDTLHRLLLIAVFTVAFTTVMGCATTCRRSEIFAASAAFVAVQVVFLQGVIDIHSKT